MSLASRIRSPGMARLGARLASRAAAAATSQDGRAASPVVPATGEASLRFELTLAPPVQVTLLLAARAARCTPGELIARAVVHYARDAIGIPALCDELTEVPERRHAARVMSREPRAEADGHGGAGEAGCAEGSAAHLPSGRADDTPDAPAVTAGGVFQAQAPP